MPIRILIFFYIFILLSTNSYSNQIFEIENSVDTAYLPYKSYEARDEYIVDNCSFPENNLIEIVKPAIADKSEGLLILSNNPAPNSNGVSMFTPRTFPDFVVTDDDPIRYIITNWDLYTDIEGDKVIIIGVCHNDDTLFVFKLFVDTDSVEYKPIYINNFDNNSTLIPLATMIYAGDIDKDGILEIYLYGAQRKKFRRLYCLDYKTLEKRWVKEISSGVNCYNTRIYEDSLNPLIIFTTGNSANGMQDSMYNDYYSFLTILSAEGEILHNRKTGVYGRQGPTLINAEKDNELFIVHYLDWDIHDSLITTENNEYYLSRINTSGEILNKVKIKPTPRNLWLMPYGEKNEIKLFVKFSSKQIAVYNLDLSLMAESKTLETSISYRGKIKIAGEKDSISVFDDGLYDKNLNKLLQFPFLSGSFTPVEYDTLGNVTAYVISEHLHYYIGYIIKKTKIELASVFYHQNKEYVLIFLSSLLVGLLTTNFFRRRSQTNLSLISKQKIELEKTHQSLKEAQATIVAQEKFSQAKDIAGGFAHEIRNNLFPAKSAINKLLNVTDDQLTDRGWIEKIGRFSDNSIDRAIKLTENISNYTKLESQCQPEEVNLLKIINDVLDANKDRIENEKVQITFNNNNIKSVIGNNEQYYIVFNNLLLNALDALNEKENSQIEIVANENLKNIIVSVKDNGCGIKADDISRIFEFFFSTKPSSGQGLGLALVKKILELYDSSVEVISTIEMGTEFKLYFKKFN